jgi:hypothetical protein
MNHSRNFSNYRSRPYTLIVAGQLRGFFKTTVDAWKELREVRKTIPAERYRNTVYKLYHEDPSGRVNTVDEGSLA